MYYMIGGNGPKDIEQLKKSPFGKMLIVRHVGHDNEGSEGTTDRLSGWVDYMLLYVKRGDVTFIIDGEEIVALKGEVFIVPPTANYSFGKNIGSETYFMHFEGKEIVEHFGLTNLRYKVNATLEFENIFNQLMFQGNLPLQYRAEVTSIYGMLILSYVARYSEGAGSEIKTPHDLAFSVLNWSFRGTARISDFAKRAGFSEAEFTRLIKEKTGMTPKEFITFRRIEEIKSEIINSDRKYKDIAAHSGYLDYQYFVKIFKKHTGMTPKEYRKKSREQRL